MKATAKNTAAKWIAYYRVSTKKQGLGLEAQSARVHKAAAESGATIIAEIEEKESGKENDRPGLNKAMAAARKEKAAIVVAKHDRLSRNLSFASHLVFESGIKFIILNMPHDAIENSLIFAVYYGFAQHEAQQISERTKAALQALKAKGAKLGNPANFTDEDRAKGRAVHSRKADENVNNIASANEIRRYLADGGNHTLQAIADHLTANGLYTSRGVYHTRQSVSLLCTRYGIER